MWALNKHHAVLPRGLHIKYRAAFFSLKKKKSHQNLPVILSFAKNILVRNCCLCVGVQRGKKNGNRFVIVWLFLFFIRFCLSLTLALSWTPHCRARITLGSCLLFDW